MAKTSGKGGNDKKAKLPTPGFRDVSSDNVNKANAALAGGRQDPLTVPKDASQWVDKKGVTHRGWVEQVVITQAYRSVTKGGLMDVVIVGKIRQSKTKENTGKKVWGHYLQNMKSEKLSEGHEMMNDLSQGKINSFLIATNLMPKSGGLKATMLDKTFPAQNSPSANSPLLNKVVIVNIDQADEPKLNPNTGKPVTDDDGEEILVKRDRMEAALPPVAEEEESDEDEDEDDLEDDSDDDESDDADDSDSDDDSDESEDDEEDDDEDESDDDDEDESEDEDDEDEEPAPAPPPVKNRKSKK